MPQPPHEALCCHPYASKHRGKCWPCKSALGSDAGVPILSEHHFYSLLTKGSMGILMDSQASLKLRGGLCLMGHLSDAGPARRYLEGILPFI